MLTKNSLLVTFPVDLGNRTIESNLQNIFCDEMDFYRFAVRHSDEIDYSKVSINRSMTFRFTSAFALRKIVKKYTNEGANILFNGLSPALFSYGVWKPETTAIALDWTRNLYPSVLGLQIRKDLIFHLHRRILRGCPKILVTTDALLDNLIDVYGLERSSLFKVPIPFLIEKMDIPPRMTPKIPRVLFVGGDLGRKGGNILIEGWRSRLSSRCTLTMMTNDRAADVKGINFLPGVKHGSDIHKKTFREHDILVLPTTIDSYPQVIGEAAAAGMTVITTKFALASKDVIIDGITGYISDTPEGCINQLEKIVDKPLLINQLKKKSYELMHQKFSKALIKQKYLEVLNGHKTM